MFDVRSSNHLLPRNRRDYYLKFSSEIVLPNKESMQAHGLCSPRTKLSIVRHSLHLSATQSVLLFGIPDTRDSESVHGNIFTNEYWYAQCVFVASLCTADMGQI
jgi:hypothetical protein